VSPAEQALFRVRAAWCRCASGFTCMVGPGRIGESTLLRQFVSAAREAGRIVAEAEGRTVNPTPHLRAVAAA
jgi:hypothetical protein